MNAALLAFYIVIAAAIGLTLGFLAVDSWLERKADERRRAEQQRQIDAGWLALLAAADEPIYEAMCFERWEAEL